MLKIGEFSKLSMLTVKTLRFYEKEGLLEPASVDEWTGYRMYQTWQLQTAARIKAYRQLGLSIAQIRDILEGADARRVLEEHARELQRQQQSIAVSLSVINSLLRGDAMTYQATVKTIPSCIVYYSEATLGAYSDAMQWIPAQGAEAAALNPGLKCTEPPYEFVEYLDGEYRETNVRVRHSQAVTAFGVESDNIKFRQVPETKVLSIYHKGAYDNLGEAYAYLAKYAEENGYQVAGPSRESYIDGIWNKDSVDEWLTEVQLPIL
ncbi:MAG: MerR family transcriptional regulator [Coriobacteriia bacterium]|nr:MerR family transcriptional regulator [Coriobacteriia bacterium]